MSRYLETIKSLDGVLFHMPYHQRRYEESIGFSHAKNLCELIDPPKEGLWRCRVVYDETSLEVTYHPYVKRTISALRLVEADNLEYSKKYACRSDLDALFANRGEADDVLIVQNEHITDTTIANIALYKEGVWYTPKEPLLKGTTRARLLDAGALVERDILACELHEYSQIALMNAMIEFDVLDSCHFLL